MKKYPYKLGSGAEGTVYRISRYKVEKHWGANFFGQSTVRAVVSRIERVNRMAEWLSTKHGRPVRVPVFYGYRAPTKREKSRGIFLVTIHEYIEKTVPARNIPPWLYATGANDIHFSNVRKSGQDWVLLDVSISPENFQWLKHKGESYDYR